MNNDDLTEADMREIMLAELGRDFEFRGNGCNCEKCKRYKNLKEMWGNRPLPNLQEEPSSSPSGSPPEESYSEFYNRREEEFVNRARQQVRPYNDDPSIGGFMNIISQRNRSVPLSSTRQKNLIEAVKKQMQKEEMVPEECIICKTPGFACESFPMKRNDGQNICNYCLKCIGCKESHSVIPRRDWIWYAGGTFICRNCYNNCRWCGVPKENDKSLCADCQKVEDQSEKKAKIDTTSPLVNFKIDEQELNNIVAEIVEYDGDECMMCTEPYRIGQPRFRVCTNRPDVHTVCSFECAQQIQEWSQKDLTEDGKVIGKQGCPMCHFPINEKWDIN